MGFKCGIVGLPNVGKSTLFNALTKAAAPAENYPFCTIEPNIGTVTVPDERLTKIAAIAKPQEIIPTILELVDIAGLVDGAAKGEGLGNQFLEHIRRTHAIAQVVRCFDDDEIIHVAGQINPVSDLETINTELLLADFAVAETALKRAKKSAKAGDKEAVLRQRAVEKIYQHLADGNSLRDLVLDEKGTQILNEMNLITRKPMMIIANTDEAGLKGNQQIEQLQTYATTHQLTVLPICAAFEADLVGFDATERESFLRDSGIEHSSLENIIATGYQLLNLLTFFTAGEKEVRTWTVEKGANAPRAAGCIHSDFETGFIRAEVISYDDYIHCQGEHGAKEAGKLRVEGKDYIVQQGDIMHFRFNV